MTMMRVVSDRGRIGPPDKEDSEAAVEGNPRVVILEGFEVRMAGEAGDTSDREIGIFGERLTIQPKKLYGMNRRRRTVPTSPSMSGRKGRMAGGWDKSGEREDRE